MIHCSHCKSEILHGAPFVCYCGFAYCDNECLYQYSLRPKTTVWGMYAHEIVPEMPDYDSVYADVEAQESQLARNIECVLRMIPR